MAFQDFSLAPPSDAAVAPRTAAPSIRTQPAPRKTPNRGVARLLLGSAVAAIVVTVGIHAGSAVESAAIGVLAGNFAFLLIAAGWSAVAGTHPR